MADNTTNLEKAVVIGGSEHLRDSDYEEALVEGVVHVGDALAKGTAETQVIAGTETGINFKGIAIGSTIRQSDTQTHATALTVAKVVKYLKPTGKRVKVRAMGMGFTTGGTIPTGAPVFFNGVGSTIGANDSQLGDFYVDPDIEATGLEQVIGRLSKPAVAPDCTTNSENVEIEFWY